MEVVGVYKELDAAAAAVDALLKAGFDSDRVLEVFKAATVVKKGSQYAMWKGKKGGK